MISNKIKIQNNTEKIRVHTDPETSSSESELAPSEPNWSCTMGAASIVLKGIVFKANDEYLLR